MNQRGQMRHYSILIKPASSLCNLGCKYCFYADVSKRRDVASYGLMSTDTARRIIGNIFDGLGDGSSVSIGFQGGEPTLAGLDFFRSFVSEVKAALARSKQSVRVDFSLQTNGILLDDGWCRFLYENRFLVGLSLDGDKTLHDMHRVDHAGKGSFSGVIRAKQLLEKHRVEYNVLSVLTSQLAEHPERVWKFLCEQNVRFVQFIPCLSELDCKEASPYALSPDRFASFYTTLFGFWAAEFESGRYISVKFFDDIFNLLLKHQVTSCGFTGKCQRQIIVEADGSVYPCDFYCLDQWRLGNLAEQSLVSLADSSRAGAFLRRSKPTHALCRDCRWAKLCGGGCVRMTDNMYVRVDGMYCGYNDFLTRNVAEINRISAGIYHGRY